MISEEMLKKVRSVTLCMIAHPDNEPDSEFADRISDLEEIEKFLKQIIEMEKAVKRLNEKFL